jgi:hypothetical protein
MEKIKIKIKILILCNGTPLVVGITRLKLPSAPPHIGPYSDNAHGLKRYLTYQTLPRNVLVYLEGILYLSTPLL